MKWLPWALLGGVGLLVAYSAGAIRGGQIIVDLPQADLDRLRREAGKADPKSYIKDPLLLGGLY